MRTSPRLALMPSLHPSPPTSSTPASWKCCSGARVKVGWSCRKRRRSCSRHTCSKGSGVGRGGWAHPSPPAPQTSLHPGWVPLPAQMLPQRPGTSPAWPGRSPPPSGWPLPSAPAAAHRGHCPTPGEKRVGNPLPSTARIPPGSIPDPLGQPALSQHQRPSARHPLAAAMGEMLHVGPRGGGRGSGQFLPGWRRAALPAGNAPGGLWQTPGRSRTRSAPLRAAASARPAVLRTAGMGRAGLGDGMGVTTPCPVPTPPSIPVLGDPAGPVCC